MLMYSEKYRKVKEAIEVTYYETVKVRSGFCEVNNSYAITMLKRRGYVDVSALMAILGVEKVEKMMPDEFPTSNWEEVITVSELIKSEKEKKIEAFEEEKNKVQKPKKVRKPKRKVKNADSNGGRGTNIHGGRRLHPAK